MYKVLQAVSDFFGKKLATFLIFRTCSHGITGDGRIFCAPVERTLTDSYLECSGLHAEPHCSAEALMNCVSLQLFSFLDVHSSIDLCS